MIDLTGPRAVAESTMTDTCTITRDAGGVHDDVLDPNTLRLDRPAGDTTTVYTGICSAVPERGTVQTEGGDVRDIVGYIVKIPATAAVPQPGDLIHMTSSNDPALATGLLRVTEVVPRTRAVFRRIRCELRERVQDRP